MKVSINIEGEPFEVIQVLEVLLGEGKEITIEESPKIVYDATVVIIMIRDKKVYLCKRLETCATYKDHYCVAGGKLEPGEEPVMGAMRELYEESGVPLQDSRFELVEVSEKEPTSKKEYVFKVYLRPGEVPQNKEPHKHTDWVLYPVDVALQLKLIPKLKPYFEDMLEK